MQGDRQEGEEPLGVHPWDDPVVQDPRALNTLREFHASVKSPPWFAPPSP